MSEKITVLHPEGFPPKGDAQGARAAPADAQGKTVLTWSIAASTTRTSS